MNESYLKLAKDNFYRLCASILSLSVMIVGCGVIYGWFSENSNIIQIFPNFAPMQFNTALCFVFIGAGLLFININIFDYISKILGACVTLLSGATFLEYVFDVNYGIDNMFVDPFVTTNTTDPGRMAPNTALCFFITSFAVVFKGAKVQKGLFFAIGLTLTIFILMSLIAYSFTGVDLYGLDVFTRMAIHTTCTFAIIVFIIFLTVPNFRNGYKINIWDVLPVISFTMLSILTLFIWQINKESTVKANQQYFLSLVKDSEKVLSERFALYKQSLLGGLGLFNASEKVTLSEWNDYVASLNPNENLPGINGIGYIDYVDEGVLNEYLVEKRQEDEMGDYKNHPVTSFDNKFIIRYSEPIEKNKAAIGLDIGFESNRREAAELSIKTARPALTKKIELVQDNVKRAGFLLLVPRYQNSTPPESVEEREKTILGWVYAPFIADFFLEGLDRLSSGRVAFTVYDGKETVEKNIIHGHRDADVTVKPLYYHTTTFNTAQRVWTIKWYSTPNFQGEKGDILSRSILIVGFFITLLITLTLFLLARINGQSARNLVNNRNQLRAIVEGAVDGLLTVNKSGEIITYNHSCEVIFGYKEDEIKNIDVLIPDEVKSIFRTYIENPEKIKSDNILGHVHQTIAKRKNGEIFPVDVSISQIRLNDEIVYSGIVRDITDRKDAEDEILRSNEELEHFAYIASHDLQEPLRMVSSFTGLLKHEHAQSMDGTALEYMDFIIDGAKRMQILIADLLEYSRMNYDEAGFKDFNAEKPIEIVLRNLNEQIIQTNAKIKINAMPKTIYFNPERFGRVLQNLIGNGVKYRHKDRDPVITVTAEDRSKDWLFIVEDNGIGMKNEYLEQIFVIFKRLHGKSEYAGTGIGLSVCKKIIENAGGEIWVESKEGKGSRFFFTVIKNKLNDKA